MFGIRSLTRSTLAKPFYAFVAADSVPRSVLEQSSRSARSLSSLRDEESLQENIKQATEMAHIRPHEFEHPHTYQKTRLPLEEATGFPPLMYTSEEFFTLEKERVFKDQWVCVGHTHQVRSHGDMFPSEVAGEPVVITNNKGKIHAFYNVCRHRGARLVRKPCKKAVIMCPYHRWGYSLNGELKATPLFKENESDPDMAESVKKSLSTDHLVNFDKKDFGLFPIRVETWAGMVLLNLNNNAPPLREYMADIVGEVEEYPWDDLVLTHEVSYEINANWKNLIDNSLEYFHIPSVHPQISVVSSVENHRRRQGKGMYIGYETYPLVPAGTALDPDVLPPFPAISEQAKLTAFFIIQFPNVVHFILPHSVFQVRVVPVGPEKSIEHLSVFAHPSVKSDPQNEETLDKLFEFYDDLNKQDIEICQEVQRGLQASPYKGGRLSFRFEEPIHRFQNMIADCMLQLRRIPEGDN